MDTLYSTTTKKNSKKTFGQSKTIWSHKALNEGFGNFLRSFDFTDQLKKITCPTLILAGQDDWICSPEHSKIMAQKIRHSKLKIFKNCGHAIAVDAHQQYINIIKKFIKK